MELTVCSETLFAEGPLTERFAAIRGLGVEAVELWGLPSDRAAAVEGALRSAGCGLKLFCGNRDHSLVDPQEREGFLSELRQSIARAARMGCSYLTILSDKVDNHGIPILPPRPLTDEEKIESIFAGLTQAAALAESAGVTLLLEPLNTRIDHPGYTLAHSAPAFDIVGRVNSPRLKVLFDAYHMQIMEGNPLATMEANLGAIGHIHVADVPGRHEPGTGEIDYARIAGMLREKGYAGSVGLECIPQAGSEAAVKAFCRIFS